MWKRGTTQICEIISQLRKFALNLKFQTYWIEVDVDQIAGQFIMWGWPS